MLKYNEIIGINTHYCPYYDLQNEKADSWKSFIPTPQFFALLSGTLEVLERENISVWLQGAYGTGKSHATGFLKHLLYLPMGKVEPIIDNLVDVGLRSRLKAFRAQNTVFPVIMYGSNKITNQIDFGLQLEIGVRRAFEKAGIHFCTATDFDSYVDVIEKDRSTYWDVLIEEELEISERAKDKASLIKKLKALDQDLFIAVQDALNRRNRPIAVMDIVTWLSDVTQYVRDNNIASHLMIYWDEFTTVLDKNNSDIHTEIQRIAEASSSTGAFLFLISHRTVMQGLRRDDRNKLLGRFKDITYDMSDVTTYLLMSHAIQKIDYESWEALRDMHSEVLENTIESIVDLERESCVQDLQNLFPIHPYTAHVSSYIARILGSTERSIFDFLNNKEHGFAFFIANCPGKNNIEFLTLDYVFDFFQKVFTDQNEAFFSSLMQKFINNQSSLEKENIHYPNLLKVLLLLNIANYKSNTADCNNALVVPNKANMKLALAGSHLYDLIDGFLDYLDSKKIIVKDHEARYLVDAANFDHGEISGWVTQNRSKFKSIEEIFIKEDQEKLFKPLTSSHRRCDTTNVLLMDADAPEHIIKNRVSSKLKNSYELNILLFIAKNLNDLSNIKTTVQNIAEGSDIPVCMMVLDQLFGDEDLERYLEFKARAEIAHKNHNDEAETANRKNVEGHLNQWINSAKQQAFVEWFVKDKDSQIKSGIINYSSSYDALNKEISQIIFYQSFDILYPKLNNQPAWNKTYATKIAEHFLSKNSYNDLSSAATSGPSRACLDIFFSKTGLMLVGDNLKPTTGNTEHPLQICLKKMENRLSGKDEINLADALDFLFKAPFGFYPNHVFFAAVAFLFRKYKGKLYSSKTGEVIDDLGLLGLIEKIFKVVYENKNLSKPDLLVRIGSENETQLVKLLEEMFELPDCNSILDTRHKLAEWFKNNLAMPLWLLNYSSQISVDVLMALDMIRDNVLNLQAAQKSITPSEYKNLHQQISTVKAELMRELKNIDSSSRTELMRKFITEINEKIGAYYQVSLYDDLDDYLRRNLQTDPIYWEEDKVRGIIRDWYIDKDKIDPSDRTEDGDFNPNNQSRRYVTEEQDTEEQDTVEQEIVEGLDNYHGELKSAIKQFIHKNRRYLHVFAEMIRELGDD